MLSEASPWGGRRDAAGTDALLQHPLAVLALSNGSVLVADSYNHKLKVDHWGSPSCSLLVFAALLPQLRSIILLAATQVNNSVVPTLS